MPNNAFKTSITSLLMAVNLESLLASRNLFHNWLSAGIKYYLIKHHLTNEDIVIRFRCDNNKEYVLNPQSYASIANAYYDSSFSLECKDSIYLVLSYGNSKARFYANSGAFLDILMILFARTSLVVPTMIWMLVAKPLLMLVLVLVIPQYCSH